MAVNLNYPVGTRNHRKIKPQTAFNIIERRKKVAELWRKHYTMTQIGKKLGLNRSTIWRDIKIMEAQWLLQQTENVGSLRRRDLMDLDEMEKICHEKIEANTDPKSLASAKWMEELRKIKQYRAELMGLKAAKKYEIEAKISSIDKEKKDAAVRAAIESSIKVIPGQRAENLLPPPVNAENSDLDDDFNDEIEEDDNDSIDGEDGEQW